MEDIDWFPTPTGRWSKHYPMETTFAPISRLDAMLFSRTPIPSECMAFMHALGKRGLADLAHGEPVVLSGALIYARCTSWVAAHIGHTLPTDVHWRFRQPLRSGTAMRARCTLVEARAGRMYMKARIKIELWSEEYEEPASWTEVSLTAWRVG